MVGIADGVKDTGVNITLEEILLWNTNYDQWCMYCHPGYWQNDNQTENYAKFQPLNAIKPVGGGCSSFSAWGEWAGDDGKLILVKTKIILICLSNCQIECWS